LAALCNFPEINWLFGNFPFDTASPVRAPCGETLHFGV
jgi:hypothetical protein